MEESSNKRIPKTLIPLYKLASHYSSFKDFEMDYITKNFHGLYWHLTDNPNFKIDSTKSPRDASSLSSGNGTAGLMVTTHIENWAETLGKTRTHAALIDLSDLKPNVDYRHTSRGFGHEIFVFKPEKAKVIKVVPINQAKRLSDYFYKNTLPKSSQELENVYNTSHRIKEDKEQTNYLYHVTPKKNLSSIEKHGILPSDASDKKAIYLFKDKTEAEDALMNWLGDKFDENEDLAILTIDPKNLTIVPSSVGYEVISYNPIPAQNIVKTEIVESV